MSVLLLLSSGLLIGKFLSTLDDLSSSDEAVTFVGDLSLEGSESGRPRSLSSGDRGRVGVDLVESRVEGRSETSEVSAEEGRSGRLESLDRVESGRSRGDRAGLLTEEFLVKVDGSSSVIDRNIDISTTASFGNVSFDTFAGDVLLTVGLERGEFDNSVDLEGSVNLSELLEEASEDDILERGDVTSGFRVLLEGSENGFDLRSDGERVEVDFEDVVEVAKLGRDALEDVTVELNKGNRVRFRFDIE